VAQSLSKDGVSRKLSLRGNFATSGDDRSFAALVNTYLEVFSEGFIAEVALGNDD
jgi:hypothetical protein